MEKNPLEQENINKINAAREKARRDMEDVFDNKQEKLVDIMDYLIKKLDIFEENGLIFDKEDSIKKLKESVEIKDKETFVSHMLKILEPIIVFQINQPKIFGKIQRESIMNDAPNRDRIKLSEVLYCGLSDKNGVAHIHLAPAFDFMTKDKLSDFKQEIQNGLLKLAEIIKSDENIKKIIATSWIVASSPKRLEDLGFTIEGEISKEEREKHFKGDDRPIFKAFMTREDFLARYDNKEN